MKNASYDADGPVIDPGASTLQSRTDTKPFRRISDHHPS
jgi:hypothetical protein